MAATAAGAGAAVGATATAGAGEGNSRSDHEAHGAGINGDAFANGLPELLHAAEGVAILFHHEVFFIGIVDGKADAGAAATAGGEIHADGFLFIFSKVGIKGRTGIFSKNEHGFLHRIVKKGEARPPPSAQ